VIILTAQPAVQRVIGETEVGIVLGVAALSIAVSLVATVADSLRRSAPTWPSHAYRRRWMLVLGVALVGGLATIALSGRPEIPLRIAAVVALVAACALGGRAYADLAHHLAIGETPNARARPRLDVAGEIQLSGPWIEITAELGSFGWTELDPALLRAVAARYCRHSQLIVVVHPGRACPRRVRLTPRIGPAAPPASGPVLVADRLSPKRRVPRAVVSRLDTVGEEQVRSVLAGLPEPPPDPRSIAARLMHEVARLGNPAIAIKLVIPGPPRRNGRAREAFVLALVPHWPFGSVPTAPRPRL
jgi:hypothetical protein